MLDHRFRISIVVSGASSHLIGLMSVTHEEAGRELLYEFMPVTLPRWNQTVR